MLKDIANALEQMDIAADHIAVGDAHNARFALMLSDNIAELTLHRRAKSKQAELKQNSSSKEVYEHQDALDKALRRHFDDKVKFGVVTGLMASDVGESIRLGHAFRNDVYHVGLQHEAVPPALASFYFDMACQLCADDEIRSWSFNPGQPLPKRAAKYMQAPGLLSDLSGQYKKACLDLKSKSGHDNKQFAASLADHMDAIVGEQDKYIDYLAGSSPRTQSRDEIVRDAQSWSIAFTDEGRAFAGQHGFAGGSILDYVTWLGKKYPFKVKADPIPDWSKRAHSVREQNDPHKCLRMYRSFMEDTAELREAIDEAASALDQHIEQQIDAAREERGSNKL